MKPLRKLFSSILIIVLHLSAFGQESTAYECYTLSRLINDHEQFGKELFKFIYREVKFPRFFREEEMEGSIKIYLKVNENLDGEILYTDLPNEKFKNIYLNIDTLDWSSIKPVKKRMLIEIPIEFDLEPFRREIVPIDSIIIMAYKFPTTKH